MTETATTEVDYLAIIDELREAHADLLKRSTAAAKRNADTIAAHEADRNALHERFNYVEGERTLLHGQMRELRESFEAVRIERDALAAKQLAHGEETVAALHAQLAELQTRFDVMQAERNSLQAQLREVRK